MSRASKKRRKHRRLFARCRAALNSHFDKTYDTVRALVSVSPWAAFARSIDESANIDGAPVREWLGGGR